MTDVRRCSQSTLLIRVGVSEQGRSLGLGVGDRFKAFRGGSGLIEDRMVRAEEPTELQGNRANKRYSQTLNSVSKPPW